MNGESPTKVGRCAVVQSQGSGENSGKQVQFPASFLRNIERRVELQTQEAQDKGRVAAFASASAGVVCTHQHKAVEPSDHHRDIDNNQYCTPITQHRCLATARCWTNSPPAQRRQELRSSFPGVSPETQNKKKLTWQMRSESTYS